MNSGIHPGDVVVAIVASHGWKVVVVVQCPDVCVRYDMALSTSAYGPTRGFSGTCDGRKQDRKYYGDNRNNYQQFDE